MRRAFTLIELAVVMGIILTLAAITIYFLPKFRQDNNVSNAAGAVQSLFARARSQARRDGVATGYRLLPGANWGDARLVDRLVLVQAADNTNLGGTVSVALTWGPHPTDPTQHVPTLYRATADGGLTFTGGTSNPALWPVQPGDYAKFGTGEAHRITAVTATTFDMLVDSTNGRPMTETTHPGYPAYPAGTTYILHRQPRQVAGEQVVELPRGVVIDTNTNDWYASPLPGSPVTGAFDIMWTPSGVLTGATGDVRLWFREAEAAPTGFIVTGYQTLLAVRRATGTVNSQPVDTTPHPTDPTRMANPYAYANDPRGTGY